MSTQETTSALGQQDEGVQVGAGLGVREYRQRSGFRYFIRRFSQESPLNVVALGMIAVFFFFCAFGELVAPYHPNATDSANRLLSPSISHPFGTDEIGRDVFSRVISGARYSLGIATLILAIAIPVGTVVGLIAGYVGGLLDEMLMRGTDVFLAFPAIILAMAIAAALGPSLTNTVIALTLVYWPWYARLVRGQVLQIREQDFVLAGRAVGVRNSRLILRHILPNTLAPIIIQGTIDIGFAVLATSSLSFIGLGAQPPTPEWGTMITEAREFFRVAWWYFTFPGLALMFTVLAFNLLGDGLRDYFDPRTRGS